MPVKKTETETKEKTTKKTTKKETKTSEKKPSTRKKVVKKTVDEVKPIEVIEEIKPLQVLMKQTDEVQETIIEEPKLDKKKPNILFILSIALNVILIAVLLLTNLNGSANNKHDLNAICDYFEEGQGSITLPKDCFASNDGGVYKNNDGTLEPIAYLYAGQATKEDFDSLCEEIEMSYVPTKDTINDIETVSFSINNGTESVIYTFMYKDSTIIQFVSLNLDQETNDTIINSINF